MSQEASPLTPANLGWLEELHGLWERDPVSVGTPWDELFRAENESAARDGSRPEAEAPRMVSSDMVYAQSRVDSLVWAYRDVGYLYAHLNPLAPAEGEQKNYYTEPARTYEQLTLADNGTLSSGARVILSLK